MSWSPTEPYNELPLLPPSLQEIETRQVLKSVTEARVQLAKLDEVLGGFYGRTGAIKEAVVFGFNPPPIQGLGATGGFEFYVQNRGEGDTHRMAEVAFDLMGKANQLPELAGVRTLFRPDVPQLEVELDRERAKASGNRCAETLRAAGNDRDAAGKINLVHGNSFKASSRRPRHGRRRS